MAREQKHRIVINIEQQRSRRTVVRMFSTEFFTDWWIVSVWRFKTIWTQRCFNKWRQFMNCYRKNECKKCLTSPFLMCAVLFFPFLSLSSTPGDSWDRDNRFKENELKPSMGLSSNLSSIKWNLFAENISTIECRRTSVTTMEQIDRNKMSTILLRFVFKHQCQ